MHLSRSSRITLLLIIDIIFFFVELIVGYVVGSLALVADSFHMLNDVMSLIVALYAIKLTNNKAIDPRYSYGWHRAEILAALINGVFLLALCFSISLEALERFFSTPDISNPKLIVVVGSLGLGSNLVGLFLFHEHGHSHGHSHDQSTPSKAPSFADSQLASSNPSGNTTPTQKKLIHTRERRNSQPPVHSPSESFSSLYGHPAATRASLVLTAQEMARSPSPTAHRRSLSHSQPQSRPSLDGTSRTSQFRVLPDDAAGAFMDDVPSSPFSSEGTPLLHDEHISAHDHGHSHSGSMNMRALVLHVLGDALGNVGVIATGLVIWLSNWSFKYYFDPVISLVITIIIFSSALPLVRSASFILLQGVPSTISLEQVKDSILAVDGVLSLHELHVWQLSETKIVASVHVLASRKHDFMPVAAKIREVLHHMGIHSSTIQPEYYQPGSLVAEDNLRSTDETSCLILCPPDQICNPSENACCPPPVDV